MMRWPWLSTPAAARCVVALLSAGVATARGDEGTCDAGGQSNLADKCHRKHHWPNVRGNVGSYGVSDLPGPKDLSRPSWKWQSANGQYATTIIGGPVIDDQRNLYIAEMNALTKLSPDGKVIWTVGPPPGSLFPDGPSLMGDSVYITTTEGSLCRLRLDSGAMLWTRRYYPQSGNDSKYVTSHDGIVVIGMDSAHAAGGGSKHILGIDGESGELVWDYMPDTPTWNNMGMFSDAGTVVLQDWDARVYHLGLHNGSLLWKAGGSSGMSWTDGGTTLGANGIVYASSARFGQEAVAIPSLGGGLHAYRLGDGARLWSQPTKHGVYTWPVAGRLRGDGSWSVVVGSGAIPPCAPWRLKLVESIAVAAPLAVLSAIALAAVSKSCGRPARLGRWISRGLVLSVVIAGWGTYSWVRGFPAYEGDITAYDAESGAVQWRFRAPTWRKSCARGDEEGVFPRLWHQPFRALCCPASFGSPGVDRDGVLYMGHVSGNLFAIRDRNNDGLLDESEVQAFDTGGAFLHSGPAFAPGLFAYTTCDTLFVYRT